MKKIGFVAPWYGDSIPGGAEMELRELVRHLLSAGVDCEVLTTCVKQFASNWSTNYHRAGLTCENGVPVRRFKVQKRNAELFDSINAKLMRGQGVSDEEEDTFQREMINSPELYEYMDEHQNEYGLFVFIPYMFGTTYYGCQVCPEKAILIPCFHDEAYAHMGNMKKTFSAVRGMVFNSKAEQDLASRLYGVQGDAFVQIGIGLDTSFVANADRFRSKHRVEEPFILYAGRKDEGKKVDVLIDYFTRFKKRKLSDLKLVLIGGGEIEIPSKDIIDLGFLPVQDKYDAYAAAMLFCNPSQFESFSLVIMESWLAGRPVLVNGNCAVTRSFVSQCNGGLYYENYYEFEKCVEWMAENADVSEQMGANGRKFVKNNFEWNVIVGKYKTYFERMEKKTNER